MHNGSCRIIQNADFLLSEHDDVLSSLSVILADVVVPPCGILQQALLDIGIIVQAVAAISIVLY